MNKAAANSPRTPQGRPSEADRRRLDPIDWAVEAGAVDDVWLATQAKVRRRRRRFQLTAGATIAGLIMAGLLWNFDAVGRKPGTAANDREMIVAAGAAVIEPERRVLPDGSIIELKGNADVRVDFAGMARRVTLVSGEAHFQVAKDTRRPFVVQAGGVEVRAVGTAFSVQLERQQVEVLVTEGRVAVERTAGEIPDSRASQRVTDSPAPLAVLDAGRRVLVERAAQDGSGSPVVSELTASEIDAHLAWRVPRLDFTRTPLSEAVPLINRHSRVKLILGDSAVGDVRLSGILQADNLETLLRLLEAEHGVTAEWRGTSEVVLRRAR